MIVARRWSSSEGWRARAWSSIGNRPDRVSANYGVAGAARLCRTMPAGPACGNVTPTSPTFTAYAVIR